MLATDLLVWLLWSSSHHSVYIEQLELPFQQRCGPFSERNLRIFAASRDPTICRCALHPVHHAFGEICCMIAGTPTNDAPKFNPGFMNALPDMSAAPIASKDAAAANDGKVL